MHTIAPSRQTLADVISAVLQANLTDGQRRDQVSAVRTVSRLLGAPPEAIPVDVQRLRKRLQELSPGAAGVSAGRWANIRSLFGRALGQVRPIQPGRNRAPISEAWETLLTGLDRNRSTRLRALVRYLSSLKLDPASVTLAHLESYRDALLNDRLRAHPEKAWDGLTWAWNACVREIPGWPAIEITRESRRDTYALPWSSFLPELKANVDAFLDWRGGFDLSEHSPSRPARVSTLKTREYQLRVAASALVHSGHPIESLRSLRDVVTAENVFTILNFLLDRHERKPVPSIGYMAAFLKYVADKYLELDDASVLTLKKLTSKLLSNKRGLTPRNRERLRPFNDPQTVEAFLSLPERIRAELQQSARAAKPKALLAQAAAAIAIQQAIPLRISNLASIELDKHLIERSGTVYLVFNEEETKNGQPIEAQIPDHTRTILAWYIREHRPTLLNSPTNALFPGEAGRTKSSSLLGSQMGKVIHRYLGLRMHAHLFRHAGAKIFLDRRPGEYEVVRQVLGHRSMQTTTSIYTGAETRTATAHFASVVSARVKQTPKPSRRARRGGDWSRP